MKKLNMISDMVQVLYDVSDMMVKSNESFTSEWCKGFNEGTKFAYQNVLKLIYDIVKEENERKQTL